MSHRVMGICGFKNSGKTTLVEKLVAELTAQGYRVSTVKHAHHDFDIDHEGRNSFRHRKAGAAEVAVVSQLRMAILSEFRGAPPPPLDEVLARLQPCDLVLVEGYKRDAHDKIEVRILRFPTRNWRAMTPRWWPWRPVGLWRGHRFPFSAAMTWRGWPASYSLISGWSARPRSRLFPLPAAAAKARMTRIT